MSLLKDHEMIDFLIFNFCSVTSSEKVDKEHRYAEFSLLSLPYPGCEFFKDFRDNGFNGINLHFDWSQVSQEINFLISVTISVLYESQ